MRKGKRFLDKKGKEGKIKRSLLSRVDLLNRFKHWYMGGISVFRSLFRVHAAKQTIAIILFILSVAFIMAAFYTNSGEFVVKVEFLLSNFSHKMYMRTHLRCDVLHPHPSHLHQYKANKEGHPECQYSEFEFPFQEYALHPEAQQSMISNRNPGYITQEVIDYHDFDSLDGIYQLKTVPFASEKTVCTGLRPDFEHDGMDKFTVVIWLEGEDPECVDAIIGGELFIVNQA